MFRLQRDADGAAGARRHVARRGAKRDGAPDITQDTGLGPDTWLDKDIAMRDSVSATFTHDRNQLKASEKSQRLAAEAARTGARRHRDDWAVITRDEKAPRTRETQERDLDRQQHELALLKEANATVEGIGRREGRPSRPRAGRSSLQTASERHTSTRMNLAPARDTVKLDHRIARHVIRLRRHLRRIARKRRRPRPVSTRCRPSSRTRARGHRRIPRLSSRTRRALAAARRRTERPVSSSMRWHC
jgi:hypothetical protein